MVQQLYAHLPMLLQRFLIVFPCSLLETRGLKHFILTLNFFAIWAHPCTQYRSYHLETKCLSAECPERQNRWSIPQLSKSGTYGRQQKNINCPTSRPATRSCCPIFDKETPLFTAYYLKYFLIMLQSTESDTVGMCWRCTRLLMSCYSRLANHTRFI